MARRFTSTDVLTLATGAVPTARAGTWIVLFRPYDSAFDLLTTNTDVMTTLATAAGVQGLFLDSGKIFSNADFGAGGTGPTDKNTWYAMAFSKATGSVAVRYHLAALGGSWVHTASGTVADGTAGITSIVFGKGPIKAVAKFEIAAAAVFTGGLADLAIEALGTTSMDTWLAASPVAAWQFNQAATTTAVADLVGSANQTALTGTTVTTDPVGWTYHASTTPFTKDVVERYRVTNALTKDVIERYRVTNGFTKDVVDTYRVLNGLTKDVVERYRVFGTWTKDVVETYRVYNSITKDVVERYRVLAAWTKDISDTYRVFNGLTKDVIERYRIVNGLTIDVTERYRVFNGWTEDVVERYTILSGTSFTKDVIERYRVTNGLTVDVVERYRITNGLTKDIVDRYRVLNGWTKDTVERYRVLNGISRDVIERYNIVTGTAFTKDTVERYRILNTLSRDVVERYNVGAVAARRADAVAYLGIITTTARLGGPLTAVASLVPVTAVAHLHE